MAAAFIVIEGIDGAGTTTHTKLLVDALRDQGYRAHGTREPSDGPVGVMIRQILRKRVIVPDAERGTRAPSWTTMALLFAADRTDHVEAEIEPHLRENTVVVSDRFDYSSVAYQSCTSGGEPGAAAWVKELNRHARRPDLTIILDAPADVAEARRSARSDHAEIYDDNSLQRRLADFYLTIDQHFPKDRIVHVRVDRPLEEVRAEVLTHAIRVIGQR